MHRKKWSNRFKKLVTLGLISIMLVPNASYATNERAKEREKDVRSIKQEINIDDKSNISIKQIDDKIDISTQEKVSVIVEFKSPALAQSQSLSKAKKSLENDIEKEHNDFKDYLNKLKKEKSVSDFKIEHEYDTVYNGVSLTLKGSDVEKLLESKVVKYIWNNDIHKLDLPQQDKIKLNPETKMNDSVPHIGVNKLHDEGLKGEGVKVGVLDTGIDYNHPDLKENYKGGYDFIDNDNDPMESTYDDWKKSGMSEYLGTSSYYTSHGTHVAGTVLANGGSNSESAVVGVAPEADLYGYRVLGPYGSGANDGIIAGIEKAVKDGMDVINLSLGADMNNPNSPLAIACNNSMLSGVVTVVANGNAGPGIGTVGTPAASPLAISVGASTTSIKLETFNIKSSAGSNIPATLFGRDYKTNLKDFASEDKEYSVVDCKLGAHEDYEGLDVEGKIALVQRGNFPLVEKVSNAKKAGAVGVVIYNNIDGPINYYIGEGTDYVPAIEIDKASGVKLVEELKNNQDYKLKLSITGTVGTEGDKLADFSSRGPVLDGDIKPDVVAPGVNIRSTYPVYINDKENQEDYGIAYSRISGTSMASPHIAGVAALMIEEKKDNNENYTPEDIKLGLMNTADDLVGDYGVNEMGAGRVDAYEAVHPGVTFTNNDTIETVDMEGNNISLDHKTGSMSFGIVEKTDTTSQVKDEIIIKNNTNKTKSFDISVEYVSPSESHGGLDAKANGVKLDVKKTALASKNSETKLGVNLLIPAGAEEGLYQGYINIQNRREPNEKYQIPFSVKYLEGGINTAGIASNSLSAHTDMYHPWSLPGLPGWISINSQIEKLDLVIKDFETGKDLGITTSYPGEWFVPGVEYSLNSVMDYTNQVYYPIDENGEVSYKKEALSAGKYIFEYRATEKNGEVSSKEFPLLIDGEYADITTNLAPGVYELTDEDFKDDIDPSTGETYNAFWIEGNVSDTGIKQLQEMGLNATKQNNKLSLLQDGMPQPGFNFYLDEQGNFKAGITKEELEKSISIGLVPLDVARNYPMAFPKYTFIKEGTSYMYIDILSDKIEKNKEYKVNLNLNNIEKISKFNVILASTTGNVVKDAQLTEEFKNSLPEGYKAQLTHTFEDYNGSNEVILNLKVTDSEGNPADVAVDGSVAEITYEVDNEYFMNLNEIYIQPFMWWSTFESTQGPVDIMKREIFDTVKLDRQTSGIDIINIAESTAFEYNEQAKKYAEKYIYVLDDKGVKHNVEFDPMTHSYIIKDLVPSTEQYTIVFDVPGHFKKEGKYIPSMVKDGKVYGKFTLIGSGIFNGVALAGDTDKDGAIDIVDARNVANAYGKTEASEIFGKDINYDGQVNDIDMEFVVRNFLEVNEQDKDAKAEGTKEQLQNILDEVGYNK